MEWVFRVVAIGVALFGMGYVVGYWVGKRRERKWMRKINESREYSAYVEYED